MAKDKRVARKLNFFDLEILFTEEHKKEGIQTLFRRINKLSKKLNEKRFVSRGDKVLYIPTVEFDDSQKHILGRILLIRKDALPELMNRETDKTRGVDAEKNEDIVESTHFIVSYKRGGLQVAFEHNHQGARHTDFEFCLRSIGKRSNIVKGVVLQAISNDNIGDIEARMNRISWISGRIRKDEAMHLEQEPGLISAFSAVASTPGTEYLEFKLKYSYKKVPHQREEKAFIKDLIDKLRMKKSIPFDTLIVNAEDDTNNNNLRKFDLLNIWIRAEVKVLQSKRHRAIISSDMFDQMATEFYKELRR